MKWFAALFLLPTITIHVIAQADSPPASHRMKEDHAPTPFSADEIRRGCPIGREDRFLIEVSGQPATLRRVRFINGTPDGTGFLSEVLNADGTPLGNPQTAVATWQELQAHASFPASSTTISHAPLTTPAGTFDCWVYDVSTELDNGSTQKRRFWFARSLPGPPVRVEQTLDGEQIYAMTLQSVTLPTSGD